MALAILSGCSATSQKPADAGFTGSYYSGHEQREGSEGAFNRLYPGADLQKYHHVSFFEPLLIQVEGDAFTDIEKAEVEAISERLHQKLALAFKDLLAPPGPGVLVVVEAISERLHQKLALAFRDLLAPPGPGVLVVVPTLVGGERESNPKDALDFIPFRIVINAGKRVYREANAQELVQYTLTIALEGFDGESGEQVLGMIDRKTADEAVVEKGITNASDLDPILDQWAERMRRNWDKVRATQR